ncbi:hypothetical protein HQN83_22265 [Pedobacter sp. LMG 31643]|nr:hypothetical protein [Pedobacter foliorum]
METTSINQITIIGKVCTKYSFIIGSTLFLSYWITSFSPLITIGLVYITLALLINSIVFLSLLTMAILYSQHFLQLLKTAGIMLFNLPVAFGYFLILTESPLT